jgi:uncharacterized repeat protein (TIGR02543 family)
VFGAVGTALTEANGVTGADGIGPALTLVAQWSVNSYAATFDAAGGAPTPSAQTVEYGGAVTEPSGADTPARDGYTLTGWQDSDTGRDWDFAADTMPARDLELVAQWQLQAAPTAVGAETVIPVGGTGQLRATLTVAPGGSIAVADAVWPGQAPAWASAVGGLDTAGNVAFHAPADLPGGSYPFWARYTDNSGQTATADFVVNIQGLPTATGGSQVVGIGGEAVFNAGAAAWGATGGTVDAAEVVAADAALAARVAVTDLPGGGRVVFDAAGLEAGDYGFKVRFTDNLDQSAEAGYQVRVQAAPVVTGGNDGPAKVAASKSAAWQLLVATTGEVVDAELRDVPDGATVTAGLDGAVRFDSGTLAEGAYQFKVTYTDDLGQSTTVQFAITVQHPPRVEHAQTTVQLGGHAILEESVETIGVIAGREIVEHPTAGRAELGSVHYWAHATQAGEFSFAVEYTDDLGQTAIARYTVGVQPADAPPTTAPPTTAPPGGGGALPWTGLTPTTLWAAGGSAVALALGLAVLAAARRRRDEQGAPTEGHSGATLG